MSFHVNDKRMRTGAADWRREKSTRHLVVYKKAWVENRCIKNCKIAQVRC